MKPPKAFDDIFGVVGSFGRFQLLTTFFICLPMILPSGFFAMTSAFFAYSPEYWCTMPKNSSAVNSSEPLWIPERSTSKEKLGSCYMFRNNSAGVTDNTTCRFGYEYDRKFMTKTVVTEWDLVCEDKMKRPFTFTAFVVGGIFGPMIWGFFADRFGRKRGFLLCIIFQTLSAVATGLVPHGDVGYWVFLLCRFFVGMTTSASYTIPFVLTLETVGPEKRAIMSVTLSCTYSCGCLVFLLMAYLIRDWRTLALVSSGITCLLYAVPFYFLHESPRWLLARGKYKELETFLRKVARVNRRELTEEFTQTLNSQLTSVDKENHAKKHSPIDLFRTPNMRRKTLTLVLINICNKGVSMGLNYYAPQFSPELFFSSFLNTIVELPPYFFAPFMFQHLGRRTSLMIGMLVGGISGLISYGVPASSGNTVLALMLICKFCITFTYLCGKLLEDEIFPTVVRSEGHSMVSMMSASIACGVPFIVQLGDNYKTLPLVIFGSLCTVASISTFILPETAHQKLPQTMEDGEEFGKYLTIKERFRLVPRRRESPIEVRKRNGSSVHIEVKHNNSKSTLADEEEKELIKSNGTSHHNLYNTNQNYPALLSRDEPTKPK